VAVRSARDGLELVWRRLTGTERGQLLMRLSVKAAAHALQNKKRIDPCGQGKNSSSSNFGEAPGPVLFAAFEKDACLWLAFIGHQAHLLRVKPPWQ